MSLSRVSSCHTEYVLKRTDVIKILPHCEDITLRVLFEDIIDYFTNNMSIFYMEFFSKKHGKDAWNYEEYSIYENFPPMGVRCDDISIITYGEENHGKNITKGYY